MKYLVKNFDSVRIQLIKDKTLLRLNLHILATRYFEEGTSCFTKVIKNNEKMMENGKKAEIVSNSEKVTKKKDFM